MTNEEYQASRGLDRPFTATPAEIRAAWLQMNRAKILHRRAITKKYTNNAARRKFNFELGDDGD